MRISDWSSDVCSSDLFAEVDELAASAIGVEQRQRDAGARAFADLDLATAVIHVGLHVTGMRGIDLDRRVAQLPREMGGVGVDRAFRRAVCRDRKSVV